MMAKPMENYEIPTGTGFSASSQVTIAAPADFVFNIMIDFDRWHEWNSFAPQADLVHKCGDKPAPSGGRPNVHVGDLLTQHVLMSKSPGTKPRPTPCTIEELEFAEAPNKVNKVRWTTNVLSDYIMFGDRTLIVEDSAQRPGEQCEFRNWEVQTGPVSYMVRMMYGAYLTQAFIDFADNLKEYSEKQWSSKK